MQQSKPPYDLVPHAQSSSQRSSVIRITTCHPVRTPQNTHLRAKVRKNSYKQFSAQKFLTR